MPLKGAPRNQTIGAQLQRKLGRKPNAKEIIRKFNELIKEQQAKPLKTKTKSIK